MNSSIFRKYKIYPLPKFNYNSKNALRKINIDTNLGIEKEIKEALVSQPETWTFALAVILALMEKKKCLWLQDSSAFLFVLCIHFQQTFIKQLLCVAPVVDSKMNDNVALALKKVLT